MDGELFCKIIQGIKAFRVVPVAAFHLSVVSGSVWADQFVPDAKLSSCGFKQGRDVPLAARETVGKLKAIV